MRVLEDELGLDGPRSGHLKHHFVEPLGIDEEPACDAYYSSLSAEFGPVSPEMPLETRLAGEDVRARCLVLPKRH